MYEPADLSLWRGRIDSGDGALGRRWHETVAPLSYPYIGTGAGIALLGFSSDEGVRRNQGRVGAAEGPDTLKRAMGGFAFHLRRPLYDCGKVVTVGDDLESAQRELARHVEALLEAGHFPLVLGGGHEVAFGTFPGALAHAGRAPGIVNFDAHFDLRKGPLPSSGTPFYQISSLCEEFRYLCLGISEPSNTPALFVTAESLGVEYLFDREISLGGLERAKGRLERFAGGCERLHLSIDADLLPAWQMPAVSAPASGGVEFWVLVELLESLFERDASKILLVDLAEFNPRYDRDGAAAKLLARLIYEIAALYDRYAPLPGDNLLSEEGGCSTGVEDR